ncbi:hypothetical protein [Parvicella tangerina]|uniref:Peptidase S74 domain-containing protein n=1 Tax=Parvicella tangerina TaxID=2829795 RepID=A0A916NEL8_9FLAO|nr:hypothetical protein [Parvicella tangerina]CAG5086970.1 hypothetical protein CRYO30217_03354 [Parvicella tangerina]
MKNKVWLTISSFAFFTLSFGQNNVFPTPSGNTGIGITSPNANLQIHGTTDYSTGGVAQRFTINHGKTSRLLLTNSSVGDQSTDGLLIRMSETNSVISNQEGGNMSISTGGIGINMYGANNRMGIGMNPGVVTTYAKINYLASGDNTLYVKNVTAGKYGIRVYVRENSNAIEVMNGTTENDKSFTVTREGEVFARKYTTTLNNIPDYVFDEEYELMSLDSLQNYIETEEHLPNVPSACEYESEGVDLGEMNRVLLEKVEELTLYILQLKEEIEVLKNEESVEETEE